MRRFFLMVITLSQRLGALVVFSWLDTMLRQVPPAALPTPLLAIIGVAVMVSLAGIVGSVLIWTGRRAGLWLSLFHQLGLIPMFALPNLHYLMSDGISLIFGAQIHAGFKAMIWLKVGAPTLRLTAGSTFFGVNVFAIICAVYLNRLRRRGSSPGEFAASQPEAGAARP
jgi:hypothetical protein